MRAMSRRLARLEAQAGDSAWQHGAGISSLLQHPYTLKESTCADICALQEKPRGMSGLLWDMHHHREEMDHASRA